MKVSIPLNVIMGITWIIGVLVIEIIKEVVGGLTVPLGFARSDEIRGSHKYVCGYEQV